MARTLSKGAQAARTNNYGSLANFRRISKESGGAFARGGMIYARAHGLKNVRSVFSPTSRYARLFGKTMLNKDGTARKKPNLTYKKIIEKGSTLSFNGPNQVFY